MSTNDNQIVIKIGADIQASIAEINKALITIQQRVNTLKVKLSVDNNMKGTLDSLNNDILQVRNALTQIEKENININTTKAQTGIQKVNQSVTETSASVNTLGEKLRKALGDLGFVLTARQALLLVRRAAQEALEAINEFDTMQTNLKIITGGSDGDVNELLSDYADKSISLGVDISEYESAAETILRTGKSIEDTNTLLKDAILLSKTGFLDAEKSAESLITIGNAYNYEAEQMENVLDKFLALDTASNTEAGALSEAVAKTAKNAQMAGIGIDSLSAQISNLKNVTGKSENEIATALNSIYSRVYNVKLGKFIVEDESGVSDITEELNDTEKILNRVGISLRDSKEEFRDFDDIIKDLSANWDSLNNVEQQAIAKTMGGTHHKNTFISMIEDYDDFMKLQDISENSIGQASEKYTAYMESLESKSASLSTAVKQLLSNTVPSNFIADITESGTAIVEFADKYKLLQNLLKSAVIYGASKGIIALGTTAMDAYTSLSKLSNAFNHLSILTSSETGTIAYQKVINNISASMTGLNNNQMKLVLSSDKLSQAQRIAILQATGLTKAEAEAQLATWGLATAENTATTATLSLSGGIKALWATISSHPIGAITTAIFALFSAMTIINSKQEEKLRLAEELSEQAKENAESYQQEAESLSELQNRYIDLVTSTDDAYSIKEQLVGLQDELIEKYGEEAEAIDLVNSKYSETLKLMREEGKQSAENFIFDNAASYEDAKKRQTTDYKTRVYTPEETGKDYPYVSGVASELEPLGHINIGYGNKFDEDVRKAWLDADLNIAFGAQGSLNSVYALGYYEEQLKTFRQMAEIYSEVAKAKGNYDSEIHSALINEANRLETVIDSDSLLIEQIANAQKIINDNESVSPETQAEFDTLIDKAVKLNSVIHDSDSSTEVFSAVYELENVRKQLDSLASSNTVLKESIDETFAAFEMNSASASDSLTEKFKTTIDESYKTTSDNVTKIEEAMQKLAEGELLSFDEVWAIHDMDTTGILGIVKQIGKEYSISLEDGIALKDFLLNKQIEYYETEKATAQESIENLKKQISLEEIKLEVKKKSMGTIDSPSEARELEEYINNIASYKDEIAGYETIIGSSTLLIKNLNAHLGDTIDYTEKLQAQLDKYEEEVDKLQEQADAMLEAQTDKIDGIIEKHESEKEILENQKESLEEQLELLEEQQEELEEIIDNYETVADYIGDAIQKEIDTIEDSRQKIEDYYDSQIERIQNANESRQEAIDLEEKLAAYQNAQKNKVKIYKAGAGYVYATDKEAVTDARNEYLSAQRDKKVSDLEKEKESAISGYDEQVKALESYADKWKEVSEGVVDAENSALAEQILGVEWRAKIKAQDTDILNKFSSNYLSYKSKLDSLVNGEMASLQKSIEAKEDEIKAKEAQIDSWENYKSEIERIATEIENTWNGYNDNLANIALNENSSYTDRLNNLQAFANSYGEITKEIEGYNKQITDTQAMIDEIDNNSKSNDIKLGVSSPSASPNSKLSSLYGDMSMALDNIFKRLLRRLLGGGMNNAGSFIANLFTGDINANGGVNSKTGFTWMDGTTSSSEVTFNAADAKKLYDFVHNTRSLSSVFAENFMKNLNKADNKLSATSKNPVNISIDAHIENVNANDVSDFADKWEGHMNEYMDKLYTESKVYSPVK